MNCSFCGNEIETGTEKIFVTKKGRAIYLCSNKCEKNLLKLKRKPRRVRWTEEYRKEKAIRLRGMVKSAEEKPKEEAKPKKKSAKKIAKAKEEKIKLTKTKTAKPKEEKAEEKKQPKTEKKKGKKSTK